MKILLTVACLAAASTAFSAADPAALASLSDLDAIVAAAARVQDGDNREPFRRLEGLVRESGANRAWRQPLAAALVRLTDAEASPEARRFACEELAMMGGDDALGALGRLLPSDQSAGIACLALATFPPGKADEILRQSLKFAAGRTRVQILNTLGDRRDPRAVPLLTAEARGKDRAAAEAAIAALGKIGDPAAAKALDELKRAADPGLRDVLAEASLRVAERLLAAYQHGRADDKRARAAATAAFDALFAPDEPFAVRRGALDALAGLDPDGGQSRFLNALRGTNAALRAIAIAHVASLPESDASRTFSSEIYHLQPAEQTWLVESLSARGDLDARLTISTCLSSTDEVVRRAAAAAIGRIGDPWYVQMLAHVLPTTKGREERRGLENALVALPGGAATDKAIADEIPRMEGLAGATLMAALVRRIGSAAIPLLLSQVGHLDPTMAKFAYRALGRMAGPEAIGPLLQALVALRDPDVRPDAQAALEQVLARIPDLSRRSILVREALAKAEFVDSRCSLLSLLPAVADGAALSAAKSARAESDPRIREAALRALADWPDLEAWDLLVAGYREPEKESVRWVAMRGLVRLVDEENAHPGPRFIEHYRQLIAGARNAIDLKVILGALAGATEPQALPVAVSLLASPGVRPEAELAVRRIAEAIKARHPAEAEAALRALAPAPPTASPAITPARVIPALAAHRPAAATNAPAVPIVPGSPVARKTAHPTPAPRAPVGATNAPPAAIQPATAAPGNPVPAPLTPALAVPTNALPTPVPLIPVPEAPAATNSPPGAPARPTRVK